MSSEITLPNGVYKYQPTGPGADSNIEDPFTQDINVTAAGRTGQRWLFKVDPTRFGNSVIADWYIVLTHMDFLHRQGIFGTFTISHPWDPGQPWQLPIMSLQEWVDGGWASPDVMIPFEASWQVQDTDGDGDYTDEAFAAFNVSSESQMPSALNDPVMQQEFNQMVAQTGGFFPVTLGTNLLSDAMYQFGMARPPHAAGFDCFGPSQFIFNQTFQPQGGTSLRLQHEIHPYTHMTGYAYYNDGPIGRAAPMNGDPSIATRLHVIDAGVEDAGLANCWHDVMRAAFQPGQNPDDDFPGLNLNWGTGNFGPTGGHLDLYSDHGQPAFWQLMTDPHPEYQRSENWGDYMPIWFEFIQDRFGLLHMVPSMPWSEAQGTTITNISDIRTNFLPVGREYNAPFLRTITTTSYVPPSDGNVREGSIPQMSWSTDGADFADSGVAYDADWTMKRQLGDTGNNENYYVFKMDIPLAPQTQCTIEETVLQPSAPLSFAHGLEKSDIGFLPSCNRLNGLNFMTSDATWEGNFLSSVRNDPIDEGNPKTRAGFNWVRPPGAATAEIVIAASRNGEDDPYWPMALGEIVWTGGALYQITPTRTEYYDHDEMPHGIRQKFLGAYDDDAWSVALHDQMLVLEVTEIQGAINIMSPTVVGFDGGLIFSEYDTRMVGSDPNGMLSFADDDPSGVNYGQWRCLSWQIDQMDQSTTGLKMTVQTTV